MALSLLCNEKPHQRFQGPVLRLRGKLMRTSAVPVLSFGIAMMMQSAALAQTEVARGLSASATMLASYEDNVFRSLDGVAAGRKSSDFRITPSIFRSEERRVGKGGVRTC